MAIYPNVRGKTTMATAPTKTDATKTDATKTDAAKTGATQTDATKTDATKTDATQTAGFDFVLLPSELAKTTAPKNARSEDQSAMDALVKRLHEAWTRAGNPTGAWPVLVEKRVVATMFVAPEDAAKRKDMIKRAATYLGVYHKFGTPYVLTEELAKRYGRPASEVGMEGISVVVMDKRQRGTTPRAQEVVDSARAAAARTVGGK
jgi:hypothetical protein